jgi:hypothetical protein
MGLFNFVKIKKASKLIEAFIFLELPKYAFCLAASQICILFQLFLMAKIG